ncbi:MAG: gamma carbonic anhydrase family protein [Dehalococcoidales bacterium]|nr:gamma carbonic anhydrase family protein [Dehalococcoidales bacterium]
MIRSFDGKTPKIAESAFISEVAYIIGDVEIGENSGVFPGAVIRADFASIKIGKNTMIEDNCVVHSGSPVVIGDNNTVGHNVVLHGSKIGNNCLIGNNATILDNAQIGDFCVIAASSLVSQGAMVPDNSLLVGVPGVVKSEISEVMKKRLLSGNQSYQRLIQRYKQQNELNSP